MAGSIDGRGEPRRGVRYPRVASCRNCGRPVLRDNDGHPIHAHLSYACRDPWGGVTGTTAELD